MNRSRCIISLAVILTGLVVVWLVRAHLSGLKAEILNPLYASTSHLPSSTANGTAVPHLGQPHEVVDTNSLPNPITTAKTGTSLPNMEILNDRAASVQSRSAAVDALGQSRYSNAVASLIVIVKDQSENIILRYKATRALGSIGDQTAASTLSKLLLDTAVDNHLRLVSALALGNMGGSEAVQALTVAANDTDSLVRFKAVQGLMRTRDKAAVTPVLKAMRDSDADVQAVAIQAYGSLAGTEGVASIRDTMTRTDSAFIKIACLNALGEAGGAEAEGVLMEYTNNSNDLLRINAQRGLLRAKEVLAQ